jgi:hypothetical protein
MMMVQCDDSDKKMNKKGRKILQKSM